MSDKSANDYVRQVVDELDCSGRGFHTGEAADAVIERLTEDGWVNEDGSVKSAPLQLARLGASAMVSSYAPGQAPRGKRRGQAYETVEAAVVVGQRDFAEEQDDFAWCDEYAALDEGKEATRKQLRNLTYFEVIQVIALKNKKGRQVLETAAKLQSIVDRNPNWRERPEQTLGNVLDLD